MSKRFHDTEIWVEDWFIALPRDYRDFFLYIKDKCDHAGIYKPNVYTFNKMYDCNIEAGEALKLLNDGKNRVRLLPDGHWFIEGFISFQYGKLTESSQAHKSVIKILITNGIDPEPFKFTDAEITSNQYRMEIYYAYGKRCVYCEKSLYINNFVIDHIMPKSKGGKDVPYNYALSCVHCNADKFNLTLDAYCEKKKLDSDKIEKKIERALKGYQRGIKGHKDKAKDKDKDKDIGVEKDMYGEYVTLKKAQYAQLIEWYGKSMVDMYIVNLNNGIGSKGYKYKSHYHTILAWLNKDNVKKRPAEVKPVRVDPKERAKVSSLIHNTVRGMRK